MPQKVPIGIRPNKELFNFLIPKNELNIVNNWLLLSEMGRGKSLSYDELAWTKEFGIIKIGELYDKIDKEKLENKITVFSFNRETLKNKLTNASILRKRDSQKLLRIKTKSGRVCKVSRDHPFFVLNPSGNLDVIFAKELKVNDFLPVCYHLPNELKFPITNYGFSKLDRIPLSKLFYNIRKSFGLTQNELAHIMGFKTSPYNNRTIGKFELGQYIPTRKFLGNFVKVLENLGTNDNLEKLKLFIDSDLCWDYVIEIKEVENAHQYVYDLATEDENFMLANGIFVHNTSFAQMCGLYYGYKAYIESDGEMGWLPIVLSPAFEWNRVAYPSSDVNLPPNIKPEGVPCIKVSFNVAIKEQDEEERNRIDYIIGIDVKEFFNEDAIVDNLVTLLIGYAEMTKMDYYTLYDLIDEFIATVKKRHPAITLDAVMKELEIKMRIDKAKGGLYHAMRGMFKVLVKQGLFTEKKVNWMALLKERKPIIISFGSLETEEKGLYQFLGGMILKELNRIGIMHEGALNKKMRGMTLTEDEEWLVKYFRIGMIIEEAVTFFPSTTSSNLRSYPCIEIYREMLIQRGRKRGFKYNFIICTNLKMLYPDIRDKFKYLITKYLNKFDSDVLKDMGIHPFAVEVMQMLSPDKFEFSFLDLNKYKQGISAVFKFIAFKSPCGQ